MLATDQGSHSLNSMRFRSEQRFRPAHHIQTGGGATETMRPSISSKVPTGAQADGRPSCRLGVVPDDFVRDVGDAVTECLDVEETQGLLVAGLAEEARAGPEHDRENLQPQLVDEVVLYQGARQLEAGGDLDFPV